MDKVELRRHLRSLRRALAPATRTAFDLAIGRHLLTLLETAIPVTRPVALYAPSGSEASPLALPLPYPTAWPRVVSFEPPRLSFHLGTLDGLETTPHPRLKIREPSRDLPAVEPPDLGALVIPGLGFDDELFRLGQGGGFYDTTLASLARWPNGPLRVGIAYGCQRVPHLPRAPHDEPVDVLVTEDGVWRPPG